SSRRGAKVPPSAAGAAQDEAAKRLCAKGNGGRHRCQPPLRRAKDLPVFVTWSENPKASQPALDPGSPAQASLPIRHLSLSSSLADLLDYVARRLAGRSIGLAWKGP